MHPLPDFEYYEPRGMREACALLKELAGDGTIVAGGTDLLVSMKKGMSSPRNLVGIARIPELCHSERTDARLLLGSCVTVSQLLELQIVREHAPLLAHAGRVLGSPQIRNRATIGGNLVTARPAADLPPALMAIGAAVQLRGEHGEREVSLENFFRGPGETVITPDEIVTRVIVNVSPPHTGTDYIKLGHRQTCEICISSVASRITLDAPDGAIQEVKIVLGAVAPSVIRATAAENVLKGESPGATLFKEAGSTAAQKDARPISDTRGSAEYRQAIVAVLVERALTAAFQRARGVDA